jgi:murein DD-endopeptidase MepM/ murein hydrolase activator NlpD
MSLHPRVFPPRRRVRLCLGLGALALSASALAEDTVVVTSFASAPLETSKGVYRIPYADGTKVKISRDHNSHTPKGRYDMGGQGGGTYRIVAAADGHVRYVEDRFDKRLDCNGPDNEDKSDDLPASEQKNNFVWIEHANGEWTKYSHMTKGSSSKAKLKVGKFVKAGTYLGDEGDVGCAGGDHLHFEVGVPKAGSPITAAGGFLSDNAGSKRNRIARICGVDGGVFVAGKTHEARKVPGAIASGAREVARHGVPAADYQCLFDQATAAGYMLEWIDGFDVGGSVYYNAIFRPRSGAWVAFHGLDGVAYQQRFDQYTRQGYRPYQVESYDSKSGIRYAAIFRRQGGPAYSAYHGLDADAHQSKMDALSKEGYRPRNVAVVSRDGQRRYTALYEKADIGSWESKSQLSAAQYQQAFDANAKQGRRLVYVNAYVHGGQPHFSAIWSSKANGHYRARHGLTGSQYQAEWESTTKSGLLTRDVTGYAVGGSARYAAIWRK